MGNQINQSDIIPFQVINYYIFQKKIEKIINEGFNPFLNGINEAKGNENNDCETKASEIK